MPTAILRLLAAVALLAASPPPAHAGTLPPLVDPEWLEARLDDPAILILDVRGPLDGKGVVPFEQAHIPGSVHTDYLRDGWRTTVDGVPFVLPPVERLEMLVGDLGIDGTRTVVVVPYGSTSTGFGTAARVYWTLRVLGHDAVTILDGGFLAWRADPARPVASGPSAPRPVLFEASPRLDWVVDTAEVEKALRSDSVLLVDARPEEQYAGREVKPDVKAAGHIPGAVNLPEAAFFLPGSGRLKPLSEIEAVVPRSVRGFAGPIMTYCNTGHWAATLWFVLHELLGMEGVRLYDASMVGWTADPRRPVERFVPVSN